MGKKLLIYNSYISLISALLFHVPTFGQDCTDQAPTVSISTNTESTICDDQTISFTGTVDPSSQDIAYVYQWQVSVDSGAWTEISGATNKDLSNYSPAVGNNRFRLAVTYCNGDTENENIVESPASEIKTVYEKKEGSVSIAADKTAVCPGEEAVYSISSINNHGGSSAKYEWLLNGNPFSSPETGSTLTYAPSANDMISLRVDSGTPCVDDFISTNSITLDIKNGTPAQPGAINTPGLVCPGKEENYSISAVTNATEYLWTLPDGSTQTTTQPNINLTVNSAGSHNLSVQSSNECGTSEKETTTFTVKEGIPAQPEFTSTHDNLCPDEIYTFTVAEVAGADEYIWNFDGNTQTTTTPSVDISFNSSGNYTVSVQATNECGTGTKREITVTVNPDTPATPGLISGAIEVCPGVSETYSITAVTNAEEYTWNFPTGWGDGNPVTTTTPEVTVQTGSSGSGNISVVASNSCGVSTEQTLVVSVKDGTPVSAGDIAISYSNTNDVICPGDEIIFSVSGPTEAEEFAWTIPTGWTINGAIDGNSITVTTGGYGQNGNVTVAPINSCGTGPESSLAVSIDPPAPETPGEISGPEAVCHSDTEITYSVSAVADAEIYNWSFPAGWTITAGEDTNSVTVSASSTAGEVSVTAENSCGESSAQIRNIDVTNGEPEEPGTITSNLSNDAICPPTNIDITFSIGSVDAADYYEWELPTGWEITNDPEGTSINVKVNANANYGDNEAVSVRGWNVCGPGNWSTLSGIAVDDYVVTDAGPDQEVCSTQEAVNLEGSYSFAGSNRNLKPTWSSNGSGQFQNPELVSTTYTPSQADISSGEVILTLTTEAPNGACGPGEDIMTIFFREIPTASISSEITTICTGTSTDFTISGTPNTTVEYSIGGTAHTVQLGAGDGSTASTTLSTGELTEHTNLELVSSVYTDNTPGCAANLDGSIEITVTQMPTATITYTGPYCASMEETTGAADLQGTNNFSGGVFTASGDLSTVIDPGNGSFIPQQVDPGTYTVTYTIPASGGCEEVAATTEVTITALPTAEISYPDAPFCSSDNTGFSVSLTGTGAYDGGTFASTTGLNIDTQTGVINPSQSTPGDYTITYTAPAGEGCDEVSVTTNITITEIPAPEISYTTTELCTSDALTYEATVAGSGVVTGGTFSAPEGLSISPEGILTPANSTPGTYTITYSLNNAEDGCDEVTATTEVTITEQPAVEISYNDGPFCESDSAKAVVNFSNTAGVFDNGTFSSETGLAIDPNTGEITPNQSEAGSFTVTYTIPSSGGCNEVIATTTVDITAVPSVVISYDTASFCSNDATSYTANYTEGIGNYENGIFSGTTGLDINSETGAITPSASSPGAHTVTYTIPTAEGCEAVTTTTEITINEEILINSQPFSLGVCSGASAQFEVSATGDNLTYKWYRSDDTEVAGATSAILEISPATSADDGGYYAIVSGAASCSSVQSDEIYLTVDENITVETEPQDQDVCIGDEVIFTVAATATGGEVVYQWLKGGVEIPGENNSTLILPSVTTEDAGDYSVFIEGPAGYSCSTITTGAGVLTVSPPPSAVAGENFSVCYSTSAFDIFNGASAENSSSIAWTHNGSGTISNETSLTEAAYTPGIDESGEVIFTLTAYGNSTCTEVTSQRTVTIEPVPVITAFSYEASEFCETDTVLKTPTLTGENAFENGTFTVIPETGLSITSEGVIDPSTSTVGTYEITYSTPDNVLCAPVKSEPVNIVIGEEPIADFSYDAEAYCKDTRDANLNTNPVLSVTEEHSGAENFTADQQGLTLDPATGAIDLSTSNSGTYLITRTIDYSGENEDGCTEVSADFTLTINDKPIPDFSYEAVEFCSDPENPKTISPILIENAVSGSYSYTSSVEGALLSLDAETGEIDVTSSDEATFTITNTVDYIDAEEDGCAPALHEFTIVITKLPDASFSYSDSAFCQSSGLNPEPLITGDEGGIFTSSEGLVIDANGAIDLAASTANDPIVETDHHTVTYTFAAGEICREVSTTVEVRIDAQPKGGELSFFEGEKEFGRLFTTCEITERNTGLIADLVLTDYVGKVSSWIYKTFSGTVETVKNNDGTNYTGSTLPGSVIESLGLAETTVFQVQITSGACTTNSFVSSKTAILSVISSDIEPTPVSADKDIICIDDSVILTAGSGYEAGAEIGEGGDFDNSSITNHGWTIINSDGSEGHFDSSADNGRANDWLRTNPVDLWTADINDPDYELSLVRYDSDIGNEGNKGIAVVSGNFPGSKLITPVFSISEMDEAILRFDQAYNLTEGAYILVEITKDGGSTWEQLYIKEGPANSGHANDFGGGDIDTRPENKIEIDLGSYMGMNNLQIRFNYQGNRDGVVWAVDGIKIEDGPSGVGMVWKDHTDPENPVVIGTNFSETWIPTKIGWNISDITTTLEYSNGSCETAVHSEDVKVFAFDQYTTSVATEEISCGNTSIQLTASAVGAKGGTVTNYPTPDGYMGRWVIEGDGPYELIDSDPSDNLEAINNPQVRFIAEDFETFNISWELYPTEVNDEGVLMENLDCPPIIEPLELVFEMCIALDFDGIDDVVVIDHTYPEVISLEAWIRPEVAGGTIISGPNFHLTTPSDVTPNSRWYHIAISDGKLYVDGIEKGSVALGAGEGSKTSIGAEFINGEATNFFSGWIEEVRLWKIPITQKQIQFMMNQRLQAGANIGEQIPMPAPGAIDFTDLAGYYRLISAEPDPADLVQFDAALMPANGETPNLANAAIPGQLINMETNQENTAPLPYFSATDGIWASDETWARPAVWDPPHTGGIDWNIVRTNHNIDSGERDIIVLGLKSETPDRILKIAGPGAEDEYNPGQYLRVTHYLLLDGNIDLVGESQLLQDSGSIIDAASQGWLKRDQQGVANSYNYNYWSSPVSVGTGNVPYTIAGVMRDGTDPSNPLQLDFGAPYAYADAGPTTPRKISNYWLHKFRGTANVYGEWIHIGSTGQLNVGEGFTMKGTSGPVALDKVQNYTFLGTPNNGDFNLTIGENQNYLIGNPYPSAMDANEFIKNNLRDITGGTNDANVFNGALYFWDHFGPENSHILKEYVGGYATYSLASDKGVPAASIDERINANNAQGWKTPKKYIPVGQSFFINTVLDEDLSENINITGGDVTFKNSQRIFVTEGNGESSMFLKPENPEKGKQQENLDQSKKDNRYKIRLNFRSPSGYHRQILVTADANTSTGFDLGYDAVLIDNNKEDMFWLLNGHKLVIQAVPDFNTDRILPLGMVISKPGNISVEIEALENMPEDSRIYIRDNTDSTYYNISEKKFNAPIEPGYYGDKYDIVFDNGGGMVNKEKPVPGPIGIKYSMDEKELAISNPELHEIEKVSIYNLIGQEIEIFENVVTAKEVRLTVKRNYSSAVYVVKVFTAKDTYNKKVIIK